jgi:hypothetical protein
MSNTESNVNIGSIWEGAATSFSGLAEQCVTFARRLQQIHPLFAEFSPMGDKSSYTDLLKQPLVWDVDESGWRTMFERSLMGGLVMADFWNRRTSESERAKYTVTVRYNPDGKMTAKDLNRLGNGLSLNDLPAPLSSEQHLTAILRATIETFGSKRADNYTYRRNDVIRARYWRLWLNEGQPWPNVPDDRFKAEQGLPSIEESWLGGTLYTWPEYEPWRYRTKKTNESGDS